MEMKHLIKKIRRLVRKKVGILLKIIYLCNNLLGKFSLLLLKSLFMLSFLLVYEAQIGLYLVPLSSIPMNIIGQCNAEKRLGHSPMSRESLAALVTANRLGKFMSLAF